MGDIVRQCRKSFSRYGNISNIVNYDTKSVVLVGRATYKIHGKDVCEWLSFRLVPAIGKPTLTEDLITCRLGDKELLKVLMEKQVVSSGNDAYSQILTLSRLSGIHPRWIASNSTVGLPTRLQYGGVLFACMQSYFLNRVPPPNLNPKVMTAMFHRRFLDIFMRYKNKAKLELATAEDTLCLGPTNESFRIKRTEKCYRFPGYFLRIHELVDALISLVQSGRIKESTIMHHAELTAPLNEIRSRNPRTAALLHELRTLPELIAYDGTLHDSSMSGSELRQYIDLHVSDGPTLYLTHLNDLKTKIRHFINKIA